jgi:hypothetical protein
MPHAADHRDEEIARAEELARDVAPHLGSVVLTHYPDADTLDTLRPGETDLETVRATNRAVAAELDAEGVEIFVQRADRAAFRRWMRGREDTPENRRAWIDRGRLLRGAAALKLLGLEPSADPEGPAFGPAPGPIADRLLNAYFEDGDEFREFTQGLLEAGRNDVLDLAARKIGERQGDDAGEELVRAMLEVAEGGPVGPSDWAELVALPVALATGQAPDATALADSLLASGALEDTMEVRFLPGWRSPDALEELTPAAMRRVLLAMIEGKEPRDLPPGDTDDLARRGIGVLLGLRIDWSIPVWDQIAAAGGLPEEADEEADEARRAALVERWRGAAFHEHGGCVPLELVPPSEVGGEIAGFLEEAGEHTGVVDEIRAFVAAARRELGEEEVVCRPEVIDDALELSFYSASGRYVGGMNLTANRMPVGAEQMPRLLQAFVRLVKDVPGR